MYFFQLCSTRNRSLRFTRFRRSYVNCTAVVLTNHCQSTLFFASCVVFKVATFLIYLFIYLFFLGGAVCLVHFRSLFLLSTRVARMLLTPWWVSRRKDVKWFSINISKLTLGVKHSISRKTTLRKLWNVCPFYNINITSFHFISKTGGLGGWDNIYFGLPYLSLESMALSQSLILSWAFSDSLTKFQNYSLCESQIKSFKVPKSEKATTK